MVTVAVLSACQPAEKTDRGSTTGSTTGSSASTTPSTSESSTGSASTSDQWLVTARSFGRVRLGIPLTQVARDLGEAITVRSDEYNQCAYARPQALPSGTSLMVLRDTVVRVDVNSSNIATAEGIRVGDTEVRVLERYAGRIRSQPHKYTNGHYLVVTPTAAQDTAFRIIFETDGSRVLMLRAGRRPAVEWVEGCS